MGLVDTLAFTTTVELRVLSIWLVLLLIISTDLAKITDVKKSDFLKTYPKNQIKPHNSP
jgi:hypothetical protein